MVISDIDQVDNKSCASVSHFNHMSMLGSNSHVLSAQYAAAIDIPLYKSTRRTTTSRNAQTPCYSIPKPNLVEGTPYSFSEIPQLRQLIQQLLQIRIGNLMLQTRNKRLGLFSIIAAQAPFSSSADSHLIQTSKDIPSCDRSNISSSVCEFSNRSTALMFSSSLNRANTSR